MRALLWPLYALSDRLDVFYSTDYLGPILPMPCKTVITVHDIIPIVFPHVTTLKHQVVGRCLLPWSLRNADRIIAVSHATRQDIHNHINLKQDKVSVVYEGKNPQFYPRQSDVETIHEVGRRYGIGERPYVLFLGTLEPKKNLVNLVKAYAKLPPTLQEQYLLVLGGNIGWDNSKLNDTIKGLHIEERVRRIGFVEEKDLPCLISGARAFCFPSLYEGFGLPVLESMACGCPVVTSNNSSLPEVAGTACLLIDPYNECEISAALERLLSDDVLHAELKNRGMQQADKFSWDKAAGEVFELILSC